MDTTTPRGALDLDLNSSTTNLYGLVLPANESPGNIENPKEGSIVPGTMIYDSTADCIHYSSSTANNRSECILERIPIQVVHIACTNNNIPDAIEGTTLYSNSQYIHATCLTAGPCTNENQSSPFY